MLQRTIIGINIRRVASSREPYWIGLIIPSDWGIVYPRAIEKEHLPRKAQVVEERSEPGRVFIRRRNAEGVRVPLPHDLVVRRPCHGARRGQVVCVNVVNVDPARGVWAQCRDGYI